MERLLVPLVLGRIWRPWRATPADYGLPFAEVRFPSAHSDRVTLAAWRVDCPARRGTALLCPGIGSTRASMLPHAALLRRLGYASLLLDFRARGASGGARCTLGVRESEDVRGALDFLGEPVVGLGQSLGAASLVLCASDPRLRGLVLEACFARLEEAVRVRCRWAGPWSEPVAARACRHLRALGLDPDAVAPVERLGCLAPRPLLLIHDDWDWSLPRSVSERLLAAANGPKELWIVPRAPHVRALQVAGREYAERLGRFLDAVR